jgi:hypothetical protein
MRGWLSGLRSEASSRFFYVGHHRFWCLLNLWRHLPSSSSPPLPPSPHLSGTHVQCYPPPSCRPRTASASPSSPSRRSPSWSPCGSGFIIHRFTTSMAPASWLVQASTWARKTLRRIYMCLAVIRRRMELQRQGDFCFY